VDQEWCQAVAAYPAETKDADRSISFGLFVYLDLVEDKGAGTGPGVEQPACRCGLSP